MTILDRYILRKHAGPFVFSVTTISFIFVMRQLVELLKLFANRNVGVLTMAEMFLLALGWILALTFPMSALVATVMAFGRLSQDSELDAIQAGGVSFLRILLPVLVASVFLSLGLVYYNNHVLPETNHRLKTLQMDIRKMRPTIAIREGVFMDDFTGYRLLVHEVDDEKNRIEDVTIYVIDPREPTRTVHAPWGELLYSDDGNELVIRLHDGEIHEVDPEDPSHYFLMEFETHDIIFGDLGTKLDRRGLGSARGDRELSAGAMREKIASLREEKGQQADSLSATTTASLADFRGEVRAIVDGADSVEVRPAELAARARVLMRKIQNAERRMDRKQRDINRYGVEVHKKYSFPAAAFVFILVGAPLGVAAKRGGVGVGAALSFGFFLIHYLASIGGEKMGDRGMIPTWLGMWAINILLAGAGLLLVLRRDGRFPFNRRGGR